jgi:Cu(I)/Ag(I) efflux system membrane fusion protein
MKLELVERKLVQASSPNRQVLSRQATIKLDHVDSTKSITAQGYIVPAQDKNQSVSARFGGRLEKLYVKFGNQYVKKGEKILDVYSPTLANVQEEHLFLLKSEGKSSLLEKSRQRLRLLGITESQIKRLEEDGTVTLTVSIFSPASGYVFFDARSFEGIAASENTSAMNDKNSKSMADNKDPRSSSATQIREGSYVNEGQTLFSVNDLREVWALVSIASSYINQIQLNQSLELILEGNVSKKIEGKIALIEPAFEETNQRFVRVRVVVPNVDNSLKINSLVKAQLGLASEDNLQVPSSAVYKTGLSAYVWVRVDSTDKGTGIFQLRKVVAGATNDGMITIESGLLPNEEIAMEAGLMSDSETFLNER